LEGPFGVFTDAVRRCDRALLIAGGIGITPVRALLERMDGDVVVLYRVVREEDAVLRDELETVGRARGARVEVLAGHHATPEGARLLSAEHLAELVPDLAQRDVYVCGPPALADAVVRAVRGARIPSRQIHLERFAL
jgi:ferredoxin-NADP reductase